MTVAKGGYKHICHTQDSINDESSQVLRLLENFRNVPISGAVEYIEGLRGHVQRIARACGVAKAMGQAMEAGLLNKNQEIERLQGQLQRKTAEALDLKAKMDVLQERFTVLEEQVRQANW